MKKLVIIHGEPGVGKTTICKAMYKNLDRSVWLDGDWCWMMNPFKVTKENKRMVEDNIIHLLRNYLRNSSFDYVIFNWVIHKEFIFDVILRGLSDLEFDLYKVTLLCSDAVLRKRREKDGRSEEQINANINPMVNYLEMDTVKIDTTKKEIEDVVEEIKAILIDI